MPGLRTRSAGAKVTEEEYAGATTAISLRRRSHAARTPFNRPTLTIRWGGWHGRGNCCLVADVWVRRLR